MSKKNDFYFWFSLILLFFLFFLIFYMYQEEFQFHKIIDTKTILTVLGTLGGAFLGAYFASRYSTNQVTRQLNYQKDMQQEQRLGNELKYSATSLASIINSRDYLSRLEDDLENDMTWEKLKELLNDANYVLKTEIEELKSINPIGTLSFDIYRLVFPSLLMIEHARDNIDGFYDHCRDYNLADLVDVKVIRDEIEEALNKLNDNIPKIIIEVAKEAELKKTVSQRLKNI